MSCLSVCVCHVFLFHVGCAGLSRVWSLETMQCVALCEGHAMAVGAVVFPKRARQFFDGMAPWMITGSKDKTIKVRVGLLFSRCWCWCRCWF